MTRESFRILTKVGNGHRESELFINWEGISAEDLKFLAGQAIRANIQASLQKHWEPGSEKIFVNAAEAVNRAKASRYGNLDFLAKLDRTPEDLPVRKPGFKPASTSVDPLAELMKALSPQDLLKLLQSV